MYVFAVRTTDSTAGVVCINTTLGVGASGSQRFCGFTPLSAVGDAPINLTAGVSDPVQVGSNWYAFNEVAGSADRHRGHPALLRPGHRHRLCRPALCPRPQR